MVLLTLDLWWKLSLELDDKWTKSEQVAKDRTAGVIVHFALILISQCMHAPQYI